MLNIQNRTRAINFQDDSIVRNLKQIVKMVLRLRQHVKQAVGDHVQRPAEYHLQFVDGNDVASVGFVGKMRDDARQLNSVPHLTRNVLQQDPMSTSVCQHL